MSQTDEERFLSFRCNPNWVEMRGIIDWDVINNIKFHDNVVSYQDASSPTYYRKIENGQRHREDGPAIQYPDDDDNDISSSYYLDGQMYSKIQYDQEIQKRNLAKLKQLITSPEWADSKCSSIVDCNFENIIFKEDIVSYSINSNRYYRKISNGQRHRLDGPAIQYASRSNYGQWFIDDKCYDSQQEYEKSFAKFYYELIKNENWKDFGLEKLSYDDEIKNHLDRITNFKYNSETDELCLETKNYVKFYFKNGKIHKDGHPAIIYDGGSKKWCKDGKLHRKDGPAIERANGVIEWWINGEQIPEQDSRLENAKQSYVKELALENKWSNRQMLSYCNMKNLSFHIEDWCISYTNYDGGPIFIREISTGNYCNQTKEIKILDQIKQEDNSSNEKNIEQSNIQVSELKEAGIRVGSQQLREVAQNVMARIPELGPLTQIPAGSALLSLCVGMSLLPVEHPACQIVAKEFRTRGISELQSLLLKAILPNLVDSEIEIQKLVVTKEQSV